MARMVRITAILILLAQLPPTYITRDSNGDLVVTRPGSKQPPVYVEPLPNPNLTPQYQIVEPGTNRPPAYIVPESDGSVEIIRPGRRARDSDADESPVK